MTQQFTGILRNWVRTSHGLSGRIYNDTREIFPDGTFIYTSYILEMNEEEGWVRTRNSFYKLERDEESTII